MYGTGGQKTIHGASFPAEIWHDYMEQALKGAADAGLPEAEPIGASVDQRRRPPSPTPSPTEVRQRSRPEPIRAQRRRRALRRPRTRAIPAAPSATSTCEDTGGTETGGRTGGTDGGVTVLTPTEIRRRSEATAEATAIGGLFGGPSRHSARPRVFHVEHPQ